MGQKELAAVDYIDVECVLINNRIVKIIGEYVLITVIMYIAASR